MELAAVLSLVTEAAGLLKDVTSEQLKKRTRRARVAFSSARAARADRVVVPIRGVYRWLGREDTVRLLVARTEQSLAEAARSLSLVVAGTSAEERVANARVVLAHILQAYVEDLRPASAARLTGAWTEATVIRQGAETRKLLASLEDHVSRLAVRDSFEINLSSLPPLVAEQALALRAVWPDAERLIAEISGAHGARPALLRHWGKTMPSWMERAPGSAHALLGSLAANYGEAKAARRFFLQAADGGASPGAYFTARAGECSEAAGDHELARELLSGAAEDHPYAAALLAALDGRLDEVEGRLTGWRPVDSEQRLLQGMLGARVRAARGDLAPAIAAYEDLAAETGTAGGLVEAAQLLLHRGALRQTADRWADARRALKLALKARNARREWEGDSAGPTELAVIASMMSGDAEGAWHLTQTPPGGDATAQEAEDQRVLEHAALTAAVTGRVKAANDLLPNITDEFPRIGVLAVLAQRGEVLDPRYPDAVSAWTSALSVARNDSERLQAARALADEGVLAPGLETLEKSHGAVVREIRIVAAAMETGEDQVVRLRANVNFSPGIAAKLAEILHQAGDLDQAAQVLRDAGERWANPHLMAMAADEYRQAGQPEPALGTAQRALAIGGPDWPGVRDVYQLLVELNSAAGEWGPATEWARTLLALDEGDVNSRWALIKCLYAQREFEQAWYAMTATGSVSEPRTSDESIIWLGLCGRFAGREELLGLLLDALPNWKQDENVFAAFIQVFVLNPGEPVTPSTEEADAIRSAIEEFLDRFPNSEYFRAVTIDEQDPLAALRPELMRSALALDTVNEGVQQGRAPLGFLASAAGGTYTEASLRRAAGVVIAHDANENAETVRQLLAGATTVIIDPTVCHTLALLSPTTSDFLIGAIPTLTTTTALFDDALHARDALAQRSTLSVRWDPATDTAVASEISLSDAERLAERSAVIVRMMSRVRRIPRRELRLLPDYPSLRNAWWLSGLDLAIELGCPYWSDDLVLRNLARALGARTFGTLAFMEYVETLPGGPSRELLEAESATLLSNYYVTLPFSSSVWRLSAAEDGWKPRGAAAALQRVGAWRDPDLAVTFVLDALREVQASDAEAVRGWVASAAVGLGRIAGGASAAVENMALFGESVVAQPWLGPQHAHFVLEGLRAAAKELGVPEPIEAVLRRHYSRLLGAVRHTVAAEYMRGLFAQADDADRRLVARVILTEGRTDRGEAGPAPRGW